MSADRSARLRAVQAAGAAAAVLALPAAVHAAEADDPPSPLRAALRAPIAGHVTVAGQMRAARRDEALQRLSRVATRLERRVARVKHVRRDRPPVLPDEVGRVRRGGDSPAALRARIAHLRRELRDAHVAIPPQLEAIAACESGGDPGAIGGGGLYRGKYQFDTGTWAAVGGAGDPAAAPEAEQDMRAAMLYERAGAAPWPVCGG